MQNVTWKTAKKTVIKANRKAVAIEIATVAIMEFIADLFYDLPKNYGLVFDIVHYIVCLQAERLDMGDKFDATSKSNPLVSKNRQKKSVLSNTYFTK